MIDIVVLYDSFQCRYTAKEEPHATALKTWRDDEEEEIWRAFFIVELAANSANDISRDHHSAASPRYIDRV